MSHLKRIFAYFGVGAKGELSYGDNILHRVGVPDVLTRANLGDNRFTDFWGSGSGGRIFHFFIDLRCRP